jgi:RNA polymerase-binding protein DksA
MIMTENHNNKNQNKLVTPFSDKELDYFQGLLENRRADAEKEIENLKNQLQNEAENDEQDNAYSFHMADAGTDAMEREKIYMMIDRQRKFIGYIDRALERIKNKTYGICKITGKPIAKERLEAIPHTEISVEAKLESKRGY